jgi:rod shape-determining protein MreC
MIPYRRNQSQPFLVFLVLSLVILLADHLGLLRSVKGFLEEKLVVPVRLKFFQTARPEVSSQVKVCQEKDSEIASLKAQIASLKQENLSARKLLGAPLPSDWQFNPARVISSNKDEIMIDKGSEDKVKTGMVVVAEGIFLGTVESVSLKMAKVRLMSSPDAKAVVKVINKESLTLSGKGLLWGEGEGEMIIRQILAEEEVKAGDLVVVSTDSADLPIGVILSVAYDKGEVFKTAQVKGILDLRSLETVFLVTGKV